MHDVQQPQASSESRRMPSDAEIRQRLVAAYSVHRSWGLRLIGMASSVFVGVSVAWALAQLLETSLLSTMALIVPLAFIPDLILWRRSTRRGDQVTEGEVDECEESRLLLYGMRCGGLRLRPCVPRVRTRTMVDRAERGLDTGWCVVVRRGVAAPLAVTGALSTSPRSSSGPRQDRDGAYGSQDSKPELRPFPGWLVALSWSWAGCSPPLDTARKRMRRDAPDAKGLDGVARPPLRI